MTLSHLLPTIGAHGSIRAIGDRLHVTGQTATVTDLPDAFRAPLAAALVAAERRPALLVTARPDRAESLCQQVNEYLPPPLTADLWPAPEALPYEQLPFDLAISTQRVALLDRLSRASRVPTAPPLVVTSIRGLTQLVMSPEELVDHRRELKIGDRLDVGDLFSWAMRLGYDVVPLVQEAGQIARRGGIVDVFPAGAERPARLDLFGDEIESIRWFDPVSQRSGERVSRLTLFPPSELPLWRLSEIVGELERLDRSRLREEVRAEWDRMLDRMAAGQTPASVDLFAPYLLGAETTLLDYLPDDALLLLDEPQALNLALRHLDDQAGDLQRGFVLNGELPAELRRPLAEIGAVRRRLDRPNRVELGLAETASEADAISMDALAEAPSFAGRLGRLVEEVGDRLAQGWRVVVASDQVDRLTELFEERDVFPRKEKQRAGVVPPPLAPGTLDVRASDLPAGWMLSAERVLVLTDLEIFGFRKQTRRGGYRPLTENVAFAQSLTPGEYVVHIDHGIARFVGLVRIEHGGVEREYLHLEYARGDKLYVPVDQSDRVTRYSGGGVEPEVTRLGSGEWAVVKRKVRRAVREMAFELIQLYARRETTGGITVPPDSAWDYELAESFPYTETADQARAIEDVKRDMESDRPMDRLVCGDVGFGKTEVALRAAFKAANAGYQVAILVPTTVLALQHFATFSQRLAPFPVRVEMLSRLRSKSDQRSVVDGLAAGSVDIVIGTHRLVQADIRFKNLGLVVIDEEQRFGVRHKEFLKRLRAEVDVMTMSATPIPRTLHMSLAGIRDISIIDTPPQARMPIRTFVTESSDHLVREVVLREIERNGQIYFVHNRVQGIDRLAHHLRHLVPEAKFGVGHGQMDEAVLEEVILSFVRNEYDVLVSTTIIESGVDIPNVNTIVIDNADTLGLTQLYQLRGRVGRSPKRAYAYLVYRPGKVLTAEARERLEAIQEATELGAGMRVAMRDMEIRGAGNILGSEQSGHIAAIGYDLYIRLLSQAVEEIRSGKPIAEPGAVTLDLPLTALIPVDYVADTELRLATYRRVAAVSNLRELEEMRAELTDRFGPVPPEVEHLLALIALRLRCEELGIESIVERERVIVIRPVETATLDQRALTRRFGRALRLMPTSIRVWLPDLAMPWQEAVDELIDAIARSRSNALVGAAAS